MVNQQAQRKNEHLSLAEKDFAINHQVDPFTDIQLIPRALPETDLETITPQTKLADQLTLAWPFYIEAITGGSERTGKINQQLATIAQKFNLAMATGSMSIIFKDDQAKESFTIVRESNPDGIILANLGASATPQQAQTVIQLIDADALEIHVNVAQELVMPEGDRQFHWLENIQAIQAAIDVPLIVKEVGSGMSVHDLDRLSQSGIHIVNISGRGGTSFPRIESRRNHDRHYHEDLLTWGLTTPQALIESQLRHDATQEIIASGGISSPLDVIKAGVIGAQAVGVAGYFLHQLIQGGPDVLSQEVSEWQAEITEIMTLLGVNDFQELSQVDAVLGPELYNYQQQRQKQI